MRHEVVYQKHVLPIAEDPFKHVNTVLICQNLLLRAGIDHILSGTRFVLADEACGDLSSLPVFEDKVPMLFLICESRAADEHAATVEELKARCSSARVVILADAMEPETILQVFRSGLDGFCETSMDRHALVKALEIVMLGEVFIPASVGLALLGQAGQELSGSSGFSVAFPAANDGQKHANKLSEREAQILRCLTQGASNKLIARELGVAEATVKVHIKAILRKVKVSNRTQAAMWAAGHLSFAQEGESLVPGE
jgi:two-component system, NarL family, nitrate/nitrite response regulator NarL